MVNKVDFGPVRRGLLKMGADRGTVDGLEAILKQSAATAQTTEGQTTDLTALTAATVAAQTTATNALDRAEASALFERPLDFTGLQPTGAPPSGGTPGGTDGQVQFNDAGAFGGFTLSGDAALDTSTGIITVASIGGVAPGAFYDGTDAADLTGTLSVNRFDSGSGASSATYLRGDGTWAPPPRRVVEIIASDPNDSAALTTGDGLAYFRVPAELNGMNLVDVAAAVPPTSVSTSGAITVQIANVTDSVDMLSTKLTIDANESDSITSATPAVIDTAHDDVATADLLRIDLDAAGTGAKGLIVTMSFQLP